MTKANQNFNLTKKACFLSIFMTASLFSLPPMLFVTFREMYGISFTLLGTLILVNFCTQLTVDLVFSAFSKKFKLSAVIRSMPFITAAGLLLYALIPALFPDIAYTGLIAGTVIFSISAGLSEVLLSPIIAALPSVDRKKDMSVLHSFYAFGLLASILIITLFLRVFGNENWMFLALLLTVPQFFTAAMFIRAPIPDMSQNNTKKAFRKTKSNAVMLALCVACIFFGSCAESAMSNWISGYTEKALNVDKTVGDILGMAMFAFVFGAARISYAKFGKNITPVLFVGMFGAFVCYFVAGVSSNIVIAFVACIATGLFVSMLWPGSLILMEEVVPYAGVASYALMASGGDLGASVAPQLVGILVDKVSANALAVEWSAKLGMTAEQFGLKVGMLVTSLFPLLGCAVLILIVKRRKAQQHNEVTASAETIINNDPATF